MSKAKKIINEFNALTADLAHLQEISNLNKKYTGLSKGFVWIGTKFAYGKQIQHGARIKYTDENNRNYKISVSISDNPKVVAGKESSIPEKNLKELDKWIKLNKKKLLDYWEEGYDYDTMEFITSLEKI